MTKIAVSIHPFVMFHTRAQRQLCRHTHPIEENVLIQLKHLDYVHNQKLFGKERFMSKAFVSGIEETPSNRHDVAKMPGHAYFAYHLNICQS